MTTASKNPFAALGTWTGETPSTPSQPASKPVTRKPSRRANVAASMAASITAAVAANNSPQDSAPVVTPAPAPMVATVTAPAIVQGDADPIQGPDGKLAYQLGDGLLAITDNGIPVAFLRKVAPPVKWRRVDITPAVWADWRDLPRPEFINRHLSNAGLA